MLYTNLPKILNTVPDTLYIPANDFFLQSLACRILQNSSQTLPDLNSVHVFIPNAQAAAQLKQQLTQQSTSALLSPYIGSMSQWVNENIPSTNSQTKQINSQARTLLLLDALKQHPDLFNQENTWQICDSLLTLFDELTENNCDFLGATEENWLEQLRQAYGDTSNDIKYLTHEAKIIYQLWQAWLQQTQALDACDSATTYNLRLNDPLYTAPANACFYIIGSEQLTATELAWCNKLKNNNLVYFINQKSAATDDQTNNELSKFLFNSYSHNLSLFDRSKLSDEAIKNETIERLSIFDAQSFEQEARAIDLKIRILLNNKKDNIGIVTEDRKLARRVRALLERSNITIQDTAGWSLSTTSAATAIERLLECIEEDFDHKPFLDLLKSPFFYDQNNSTTHLKQVSRLEKDIIINENIPRDINRYLSALSNRQQRLHHWPTESYNEINKLLSSIQNSCLDLKRYYESNSFIHPAHYLNTLIDTLKNLGIYLRLESDSAGIKVITTLQNMIKGLEHASPAMNWNDFRTWLGYNMEEEEFTPFNAPSIVQLMNLKQAQYCNFDALIIAGATKDSLPGNAKQTPFFNQSVRTSLGLSNWANEKQEAFNRFCCLLESADTVLITYSSEIKGEWQQPSPWVTSLIDFSKIALNANLQDITLKDMLLNKYSHVNECDLKQLPEKTQQPAPGIDKELININFSASKHQRLINCPYQFFSADVLSLRAGEQVTEELQKSEYGEKVHLILYAFHTKVDGYPAPFKEQININNKNHALNHLEKLSRQIFEHDLEDSIQHRGWLQRWLNTAPYYINWQIERQQEWSIHQLERKESVELSSNIILKGRLDRIDTQDNIFSIIDYKTGASPKQKDIDEGEDVQLVSYAIMMKEADEVAYMVLDKEKTRTTAHLEDDALHELKELSRQRLIDISNKINKGESLPAWGDKKTCEFCDMDVLCRKQIWG
jgi:ATP-dependent helicase/nuclease subunit B